MAWSSFCLYSCLLVVSPLVQGRVAKRVSEPAAAPAAGVAHLAAESDVLIHNRHLSKSPIQAFKHLVARDLGTPVNEALVINVAGQHMIRPIPARAEPPKTLSGKIARFWSALKRDPSVLSNAAPAALELHLGQSDQVLFRGLVQRTSQGLRLENVAIASAPINSVKTQDLVEDISPFQISVQSTKNALALGKIVKRSDGAVFVRDMQIDSGLHRRDGAPSVQGADSVPHTYKTSLILDAEVDSSVDEESDGNAAGAETNVESTAESNADVTGSSNNNRPSSKTNDSNVIVVPLDIVPLKGTFTFPLHDVDGNDTVDIDGNKYKVHASQTVGYDIAGTGAATFQATITTYNNAIYSEPITEITSVSTLPITDIITHSVTEVVTQVITQAVTQVATEKVTQLATETVNKVATQTVTQVATQTTTLVATKTVTTIATETVTDVATEVVIQVDTEVVTQAVTETATQVATQVATESVTEFVTVTTQVLVPAPEPTVVHDATPPQVHHLYPEDGSADITVTGADGDVTVVHPATETATPTPANRWHTFFEPLTGDHVHVHAGVAAGLEAESG